MIEKLKNLLFRAKMNVLHGVDVVEANNGRPIEQVVIRYKDFFFLIDFDAETKEPTGGWGWSEGTAATHIPIRDFSVAISRDDERVLDYEYYEKRENDALKKIFEVAPNEHRANTRQSDSNCNKTC